MRKFSSMIVAAVVVASSSVAMADFAVNTNLGTLGAGSVALTGTTVGGVNNASTYTGANAAAVWFEEFVFQFTTTSPFTISMTSNDPNAGPTGPDNDFFLTNTLSTPGGVGQAILSQPTSSGFSGVEVSGGWGLQPAGTYYLIADAFRGGGTTSTATAISGSLTLAGFVPPTPPVSIPATLGGSLTGSLAAAQVTWYSFTTTGGAVSFDTEGSTLSGTNDTELFLYDAFGTLLGTDDDDGTGNLSILNSGDELPASLAAGTYYLAIGAFNTTGNANWAVTSTSTQTGNYIINGLNVVVPEPTSLALIGLSGMMIRRRRSN